MCVCAPLLGNNHNDTNKYRKSRQTNPRIFMSLFNVNYIIVTVILHLQNMLSKCDIILYHTWLVVWNICLFSHKNWEFHHPSWLSHFSEGLKPPTSIICAYIHIYIYTHTLDVYYLTIYIYIYHWRVKLWNHQPDTVSYRVLYPTMQWWIFTQDLRSRSTPPAAMYLGSAPGRASDVRCLRWFLDCLCYMIYIYI